MLSKGDWLNPYDLTTVLECDAQDTHWLISATAFIGQSPEGILVKLPDVALPQAAQDLRHAFLKLLSAVAAGAVPPSKQGSEVHDLPRSKSRSDVAALVAKHLDGIQNTLSGNALGSPAVRIQRLTADGLNLSVEDVGAICSLPVGIVQKYLTTPANELPYGEAGLEVFLRLQWLLSVGLPVVDIRSKPVTAAEAF